jgi:hypothetical protein
MGRCLSFLMERGRLRGGSLFFVPERLGRGVEADQTAFLSKKHFAISTYPAYASWDYCSRAVAAPIISKARSSESAGPRSRLRVIGRDSSMIRYVLKWVHVI